MGHKVIDHGAWGKIHTHPAYAVRRSIVHDLGDFQLFRVWGHLLDNIAPMPGTP
jgi:hypothetical protein